MKKISNKLRVMRFAWLIFYLKIIKLYLPTFSVAHESSSFKNVWKHSKYWRFS